MIAGRWGAATDIGHVRQVNEDSFLARAPLFVVADGMGGHAAGDIASRVAIESFEPLVGPNPLNVNDATGAVSSANRLILETAVEHPEMAGMGTTVAGLAVVTAAGAEHWQVFHVGDCRVYRFAAGRLTQLTVDHSEAEEMVNAGRLSRDQARSYARRNVLTRSLGTRPPPQVDSLVFPPNSPERFLICSDGLTTEVDDTEIAEVLADEADPQVAAERLVELALAAGGHDNVTAVVVDGEAPLSGIDEDTTPRGAVVG